MKISESSNKNWLKYSLSILFVAFCFASTGFAQLSIKGIPQGLRPETKTYLSTPEWFNMPDVDVQKLMDEDKSLDTLTNIPFRLAIRVTAM